MYRLYSTCDSARIIGTDAFLFWYSSTFFFKFIPCSRSINHSFGYSSNKDDLGFFSPKNHKPRLLVAWNGINIRSSNIFLCLLKEIVANWDEFTLNSYPFS